MNLSLMNKTQIQQMKHVLFLHYIKLNYIFCNVLHVKIFLKSNYLEVLVVRISFHIIGNSQMSY